MSRVALNPVALNRIAMIAALLLLGGGCDGDGARPGARLTPTGPPDVLLITLDTFRADRAGCMGDPRGLTPALDRLVRNGLLARRAWAPAPLTAVSHASLLTGLEPPRHGVRDNGSYVLADSFPTLGTFLADEDLVTGAFVAAFPLEEQFGFSRGFGVYDDRLELPEFRDLAYAQRPAASVVDSFLEWLGEIPPADRWFAWVHFFDPHHPRTPPRPLRELAVGDDYDREIRGLDAEIRRLARALEFAGGGRLPVLAVTSDHGEGLGDHQELSHGVLIYRETMHGFFALAAPPGTEEAGRLQPGIHEGIVRFADLAPTLLDVLDIDTDVDFDGRSLLAPATEPPGAYGETYNTQFRYGWSPLLAWRDARWSYIASPHPELYDLVADPGERKNVIEDYPRVAEELADRVAAVMRVPVEPGVEMVTEEAKEKLMALGYLGGGAGTASDFDKDPKEYVGSVNAAFRGMMLLAEGDAGRARSYLQHAYRLDPDNVMTVFHLADCLRTLGDNTTAMSYYRRAIELNPAAGEAWAHLAILEHERGSRDTAFRLLDEGLGHNPRSFPLLMTAGDLFTEAGRYDAAEDAYDRAGEIETSRAEPWIQRARMEERRGRPDAADAAWQNAGQLEPDNDTIPADYRRPEPGQTEPQP